MSVIRNHESCGDLIMPGVLNRVVSTYPIWIVLLAALFWVGISHAEPLDDRPDYINGYVAAILYDKLKLGRDDYHIEVGTGEIFVLVNEASPDYLSEIEQTLKPVAQGFDLSLNVGTRESAQPSWIAFPKGYLFRPSIAGQHEPKFSLSMIQVDSPEDDVLVASVGLGHEFGLIKWETSKTGTELQLSIFAAAFSQFNMDSPSDDLLNTDYQVGFPLSFRSGKWSGKFRLYHQSSHLGDELILGGYRPDRIGLSVEVADFKLARQIDDWRLYGGAGYILRAHDPEDIERGMAEIGVDYVSSGPVLFGQRLVGGVNVFSLEEREWRTGTTIRLGLSFGRPYPDPRGISLLFEGFKGIAPFGQFYVDDIRYYGVGLYFDI